MNVKKIFILLFSVIVVTSSWAMLTFDSTLYNARLFSLKSILIYLTLFLSCFVIKKKSVCTKRNIYLCVPILFYFLFTTFHRYTDSLNLNIASNILLCVFVLLCSDVKNKLYKIYYYFFTIISAYGILCYLSYGAGLHIIPFRLVEYYTINAEFYVDFYACTSCLQGSIIRFCGLYNEPGLWGTIAALILCVEDLNFHKLSNILILVAGAFTFSFAFWVILVVYYVLSRGKFFSTLWVIVVLAILYVYVVPKIETGNEAVDALIGRLTYEDGEFAGDNRSNEHLDYLLEKTLLSTKAFFGHGGGYIVHLGYDGSLSYKTYIVEHGILGFLLMYGSLLIAVLKYAKKNRYVLPFVLVFFLSIYQRPGVFSMVYMVILLGGIDQIMNQRKTHKLKSLKKTHKLIKGSKKIYKLKLKSSKKIHSLKLKI